jgi:ribulose-phosphate 3-epimerase|tara:strand:+ start:48710 stop:49714 length:1005 start_codon:yes stop_codon:yes gene_type:complete
MKISASIYSDTKRPLKEVIEDLIDHKVDLLHVDCNDDTKVFDDIKRIRQWTNTPIDLHIITETPEKYFDLLRETPVEYVTFQYEQLKSGFKIPDDISGKKGLAVITPTSVDVFNDFPEMDFILIMATIPGQSGGVFDAHNFSKIRNFRNQFPGKAIHVDGGVNGEVSFILRNLGVRSSVSGSYLFKAPSIGHALMDLTTREMDSHFKIKDFMIPIAEAPTVLIEELSNENILKAIENGNLGFCIVVNKEGKLEGLSSNADVRKGLLRNLSDFNAMSPEKIVNRNPVALNEEMTVVEMMKVIRECSFQVSYLPVKDSNNRAKGIVTFVNLIKGEL